MIKLRTLTDGGQDPPTIARELIAFLDAAERTLKLALYDIRLPGELGDSVRAAIEGAAARGVDVRLLYNVDHAGPIAVPPPPQTIPAGGRGDGWLQDYYGGSGSVGTFSYQGAGDFSVSCPTGVAKNTVSGAGGNFVARSAAGDWSSKGIFPAYGHPLQVIFTVGG